MAAGPPGRPPMVERNNPNVRQISRDDHRINRATCGALIAAAALIGALAGCQQQQGGTVGGPRTSGKAVPPKEAEAPAAARQPVPDVAAYGYTLKDEMLPGDEAVRVAGRTVTTERIRRAAGDWQRQMGGDPAADAREQALWRLIDEAIIADRKGKETGDDPRVARARWLAERTQIAGHYLQEVIRPKIVVQPSDVAARMPASRDQLTVDIMLFSPEDDQAIAEALKAGTPFAEVKKRLGPKISGGMHEPIRTIRRDQSLLSVEQEEHLWGLEAGQVSHSVVLPVGAAYVKVESRAPIPEDDWQAMLRERMDEVRRRRFQAFVEGTVRKHAITEDASGLSQTARSQKRGAIYDDFVIGRVDGREIRFKDIDRVLPVPYIEVVRNATEGDILNYYQGKLKDYSMMVAVAAEADGLAIELNEREKAGLKEIVDGALQKVVEEDVFKDLAVTEEEIIDYYRRNAKEFSSTQLVLASVVTVKDRVAALTVEEEYKGGVPFDKLVEQYSTDRLTRGRKGDMGWISLGSLPADIAKIAMTTPNGRLLPVFEYGGVFNVMLVRDKKTTDPSTIDQVRDRIRRRLMNEKKEAAYTAFIKKLRQGYTVTVDWTKIKAIELPMGGGATMMPPGHGGGMKMPGGMGPMHMPAMPPAGQ